MKELFEALGEALIKALPLSPFAEFYGTWVPPEWLGWLNWFLPVEGILKVMAAWLVAIGVYYAYSVVARWVGLIA